MNLPAVAARNETNGDSVGSDSEEERASTATRSTKTAYTRPGSVCSASYASELDEYIIKPTADKPWQVSAVDAAATDDRGVGIYGVATGNWGHLKKKPWVEHRNLDLRCGPYHLLALQEADNDLLQALQAEAIISKHAAAQSWEDRQERGYIAVLGHLVGDDTSLLFACRTSLFSQIDVLLERKVEGRQKKKQEKQTRCYLRETHR